LREARTTTLIEAWPQNTNPKFIDREVMLTSVGRKSREIRNETWITMILSCSDLGDL